MEKIVLYKFLNNINYFAFHLLFYQIFVCKTCTIFSIPCLDKINRKVKKKS